jgi:hypothetical protein
MYGVQAKTYEGTGIFSFTIIGSLLTDKKCDETRPRCLHCLTVERTCTYRDAPSSTEPDALSRASSSGAEKTTVALNDEARSPARSSPTAAHHLTTTPYVASPDQAPETAYAPPEQLAPEDPEVNMLHMELFHHFLTSTYGFVESEQPLSRLVRDVAVVHAVTSPFLMHQLLAFAARHRSCVDPDRQHLFRHLAERLQTRAIALFNRVDLTVVSPAERVSIFLFSSLLGFQTLCDTLSAREEDFEAFWTRYLGYVRLHRGVHSVIQGSWELLRESALRPVLDAGGEMHKARGEGHECDDYLERIGAANTLSDESKEACRDAVRHLQWVFDARPDVRSRVNVLIAWVAMVPEAFIRLLEARCKEALCVHAYYFVLLHFCNDVWFVAGSGEGLLMSLDKYLGPEWEAWMRRPKELLRECWS